MEHKEFSLIRGRSDRGSDGRDGNSDARIDEIFQLLNPLAISFENPASLSPAPRNARQHSRRQVSQLCASIGEFGFLVPILVDERRTVIAGHGRLAAAQQLGLNQVPVVHIGHLTAEQKRAYLLADNRLAELSGWDTDILKVELEELSVLNLPFEFEITGFDTVDIDRLRETPKKAADDPDDHLPELAELPVSCPGDLWALGPHRLLCGNSCEPGTYKRLLGATAVDMVFTDPPYNVPIQGHVTTQARHREFAMASGEMTPQEFTAFLERSFRLMHEASSDGAIHFICMDWRHLWEILAAGAPVYLPA
jgi:16S rRNA G966 N2-methylase RsmD